MKFFVHRRYWEIKKIAMYRVIFIYLFIYLFNNKYSSKKMQIFEKLFLMVNIYFYIATVWPVS